MDNSSSEFPYYEELENEKSIFQNDKSRKLINYTLFIFSVINIIIFILLIIVVGFKPLFNYSRIFVAILFILLIQLNNKFYKNKKKISTKLKIVLIIFIVIFILFLIVFIILSNLILTGYNLKISEKNDIDYLIILGNILENNKPGYLLRNRLDKSIEYYNRHKNIKIIVSGGKTSGDISEAEAMKNYLVENCNITNDQIIIEDESQNTIQNLKNILKKINIDQIFGLCTSNSHIYRSYGLAKSLGYEKLYPLSAKGSILTFLGDIIREVYCIIFEVMIGNMKLYIL